jgi:hypothetical protein
VLYYDNEYFWLHFVIICFLRLTFVFRMTGILRKDQRHFLPRIGEHPDQTLCSVIMEWNTREKAPNIGKDVVVPVEFPSDIMLKHITLNEEYVPYQDGHKESSIPR